MRIASLLLGLVLLQGCATPPRKEANPGQPETRKPQSVIQRSDADYYFSDWRSAGAQQGFEVMPLPVGGMKALISRLEYPTQLRRQRIGAEVRLLISFDASGRVLSVRVIQSGHPLLSQVAVRAVLDTRWTPALKNGHPTPVRAILPLTFLPP